jgi:hypothetical protein
VTRASSIMMYFLLLLWKPENRAASGTTSNNGMVRRTKGTNQFLLIDGTLGAVRSNLGRHINTHALINLGAQHCFGRSSTLPC